MRNCMALVMGTGSRIRSEESGGGVWWGDGHGACMGSGGVRWWRGGVRVGGAWHVGSRVEVASPGVTCMALLL